MLLCDRQGFVKESYYLLLLIRNSRRKSHRGVFKFMGLHSRYLSRPPAWYRRNLKPNSVTLSGRRHVRSGSQTCSELEFGLSSSSLAAI